MNVSDLARWMGKVVLVRCERPEISVECHVVDGRVSFGKPQLQVTPVAGSGSTWVDLQKCKVVGERVDASPRS